MFLGGFHIILVPKEVAKTKRFQFSPITARLLALGIFLLAPLLVGSLFATVHFQKKAIALKSRLSEERQILEQKELLATRMSRIERALARTGQTLGHLENTLDIELGQVEAGTGPVDKEVDLDKNARDIPELNATVESLLENTDTLTLGSIRNYMDQSSRQIASFQNKIDEIIDIHRDKIRFLDATPNFVPVEGWITSGFGYRKSPYNGIYKMHYGIDIAAPIGTAIRSPADGKVVLAEFKGGYGRKVVVDHGYGISTVYAHGSEMFVKEGQIVKRGDKVAAVGSSGASTGPHLHYEIHVDGFPVDPFQFVMK